MYMYIQKTCKFAWKNFFVPSVEISTEEKLVTFYLEAQHVPGLKLI